METELWAEEVYDFIWENVLVGILLQYKCNIISIT